MGGGRVGCAAAALVLVAGACAGGGRRTALDRSAPPSSTPAATTSTTTTTLPVATAPSCPAAPPRAAPDARRPRYSMQVQVRLDQNLVSGTMAVSFTPDLDTDRVVFRLWPNARRTAQAGAKLDVGPVGVDGRPVPVDEPDPTTLVAHTGPLTAGHTVTLTSSWMLTLPGPVDDRISRVGNSVRLGSFFPILPWEPGVGWALEPPTSGFAEATTSPTADFDVTVEIPAGLTVLASGVASGPDHWSAPAVRDFAMSVGQFALATAIAHAPDPVQVTVGVQAGLSDAPQPYADKIVHVLEDDSRRFGPYPWPTYSVAITPALSGGIEYPTHVMEGPGRLGRTTSHEVGHQWFYSLVGDDQGRDPWLDEGLATWAEARFEGSLDDMRSRPVPAGARGHLGEPMTYWEPRQSSYYAGVYVQGAQALAALGPPDLVDCALRVYAAVDAYRIARPADLVRALRTVFPDPASLLAPFGVRA